MSKQKTLAAIIDIGVVPIVRAPSPETALQAAEAIYRGGIRAVEITMTVPGALRVLEKVADKFGDQITLLAIPIIAVLTLNAAPEQMGLLTAAGLLPHLLFSLPAGVWIDRVHRRRRLMVLADIARAVVILSIAVAFALNTLTLAQLYIVTFVVGALSVGFDISWNTVFVKTVERALAPMRS